jgi:hypothetical protein
MSLSPALQILPHICCTPEKKQPSSLFKATFSAKESDSVIGNQMTLSERFAEEKRLNSMTALPIDT